MVGLRELRQPASELVRRVEAGEEITITVAGRPSARLVAVTP
jgi:prevent-host-death family protein